MELSIARGILQADFLKSYNAHALTGLIRSKRTPIQHVSSVMAVLGAFNVAGVLPPEIDPRANQLIRALIQFQSMLMKSQEPAVREYLVFAFSSQTEGKGQKILSTFYEEGWTSESLEALVDYSRRYSMTDIPKIKTVFQSYNVNQNDWALIQKCFLEARQRFQSRNQNFHNIFADQRRSMLGDKTNPID